jgi:carbon monoxide dehydrogenase subunit G
MIIEERFVVNARVDQVWNFLLDAQSLAGCVPGCDHVEPAGENSYKAHMKAKIGPISANFKIRIDIAETNPPIFLRSTMRGEDSKMASHLNASNVIELTSLEPEKTEIYYRSEVNVLGRLGKFGEGIMKRKAKEVGEQFARSVKARLEATPSTS